MTSPTHADSLGLNPGEAHSESFMHVDSFNIRHIGEPTELILADETTTEAIKPFEVISGGAANLHWLLRATYGSTSSAEESLTIPFTRLRGISGIIMPIRDEQTSIRVLKEALSFRYFSPKNGEETQERIVLPTGFAYGVHQGHRGIPERKIAPELPTWYLTAQQIGTMLVNNLTFHEPGERNFPLSRIIGGPLGDPRDPVHRAKFGIY